MRFPLHSRRLGLLLAWALVASLGSTLATAFEGSPELPSVPASARAEAVIEDDGPQLRARLLVSQEPTPRVGVLFDLAPGWHLYWRNPGETGIAPRLGLEADAHRIGEVAWPAPRTFREADGLFTTYGYEDRVLLAAPLRAPAEGAAGEDILRSSATVLVCRTQCVPASFSLSTPAAPTLSPEDRAVVDTLFRDAASRVPRTTAEIGLEAEARWMGPSPAIEESSTIELVVRSCGEKRSACSPGGGKDHALPFIPLEAETFEFSDGRVTEDRGDAAFGIELVATRLEEGEDRLRGLVEIRDASGIAHPVELDLPIRPSSLDARAAVAAVGSTPRGGDPWTRIFLLALLGGLILNGMPCVLPVLAIKVVAIASLAEQDARQVRLHGLAYTGGVLASMALLAGIVIGLRAAGHSVGWGFQFQEPLFVAAIGALLVAFALNLFGVFEIELGQGRLADIGQHAAGLRRSAFEGLLAVVLATPCTAPFLGTAVGFAFASSDVGVAAIFLAIGLGLASPFLLVSFEPRLARFVPRSGPWMIKLRGALGFCLLATVVWLLWILGRTGGAHAVIAMVGNLLFLSFLLWGFGQIQPIRRPWAGRLGAALIVCLAVAGLNWIDLDRAEARAAVVETADAEWLAYSEEAVREELANGRPVFVVFTADWCLTCKVNEETVLARSRVREALHAGDFALFEADWTRRDEAIRRKLAEFGRAGVPLYLVYSPDAPDTPRVLSEILSQNEVIAAIDSPRFADRR